MTTTEKVMKITNRIGGTLIIVTAICLVTLAVKTHISTAKQQVAATALAQTGTLAASGTPNVGTQPRAAAAPKPEDPYSSLQPGQMTDVVVIHPGEQSSWIPVTGYVVHVWPAYAKVPIEYKTFTGDTMKASTVGKVGVSFTPGDVAYERLEPVGTTVAFRVERATRL
ncbi:MAG: hypothetical protein KGI79_00890 [Patescibacteria group bacterium]|nr:hypothetical protein [Patescibacteria group bacterium]MDE2116419.1 hypothetical protein [Patescibacteria group bacterium]